MISNGECIICGKRLGTGDTEGICNECKMTSGVASILNMKSNDEPMLENAYDNFSGLTQTTVSDLYKQFYEMCNPEIKLDFDGDGHQWECVESEGLYETVDIVKQIKKLRGEK